MSPWLVDASVLLAYEDLDDDDHAGAARLIEGAEAVSTLDLALYEVSNVAIRAWNDRAAARRLRDSISVLAGDGGIVRADAQLLEAASELAMASDLSVYDAAYVAAAAATGAELVSCDVRDLVSRGLARLPADAVGSPRQAPGAPPARRPPR